MFEWDIETPPEDDPFWCPTIRHMTKDVLREASEIFRKDPAFQSSSVTPKRSKKSKLPTYDLNAANLLPDDCTPVDLDRVIDFAYTGRLPLFPDTSFENFFKVAVALHFSEALKVYNMHLKERYKPENQQQEPRVSCGIAASIISQSQKICKPFCLSECSEYLHDVFEDTSQYLLKEPLDRLIGDEEFLRGMTAVGMAAFLGRDDLAKRDEEIKVLELALAWLRYDGKNRQQHAKMILEKIHLGILPRQHLITLVSEVEGSAEGKELVEEVLKMMDTKDDLAVPLENSHPHMFAARNELPCNSLIGIGPCGLYRSASQTLLYFNSFGKKIQGWQNWCGFESIPNVEDSIYGASVLAVDGKLYVAGGFIRGTKRLYKTNSKGRSYFSHTRWSWNVDNFYEGKVGESVQQTEVTEEFAIMKFINPWSALPPMKNKRMSFPMVHLDGYLYAIGGQDEDYKAMTEAERYSFSEKKWEKIADLPVPCYYASATTYKGKILVYGSQAVPDSDTPAQHELQMYDPTSNQWANLLNEHHQIAKFKKEGYTQELEIEESKDEDEDSEEEEWRWDDCTIYDLYKLSFEGIRLESGILLPKNVLVIDRESVFRVVYNSASEPVVHQLDFDFEGASPSVMVGPCQDQSLLPATGEGAFQINGKVYVNLKGAIHNTGIKITPGQESPVDLGVWKKLLDQDLKHLTVANLAFNKKAVFCENCVRGKKCVNIEMDVRESDESGSESDSYW